MRPLALLARLNGHFLGRIATTLVLIGATFQVYWYLNHHLPPRFDLMTPLDRLIPFVPWTLPAYQSFFVLLVWAAWKFDAREFLRLLAAVLLANIAAYLGFILFTSHYPRPDWRSIPPGLIRDAFASMFAHDAPGNTFPSIHVAVTTLVVLRLRQRRFGRLWLVWGAVVVVSTLTVKQHHVADVIGGVALAVGLHAWLFPRAPLSAVAPARNEERRGGTPGEAGSGHRIEAGTARARPGAGGAPGAS
jgi:membrane-associated phospholipid phosphatase